MTSRFHKLSNRKAVNDIFSSGKKPTSDDVDEKDFGWYKNNIYTGLVPVRSKPSLEYPPSLKVCRLSQNIFKYFVIVFSPICFVHKAFYNISKQLYCHKVTIILCTILNFGI